MNTRAGPLSGDDLKPSQVRAARLAPRPKSPRETGLGRGMLCDLVEKHLYDAGLMTLAALGKRMALAGPVLEEVLSFLRRDGRIEVRGQNCEEIGLRYALSERGRLSAQNALARSGYVGPAPVPLELYTEVVRQQTVHSRLVTRERMQAAFSDIVLDAALLDRLGPALNSGKAIFVYGGAGTGKTYIAQRLSRLLDDTVLVPHAVAIDETIVSIFDPAVHVPLGHSANGVLLDEGHDPRFLQCRRPLVITGGELVPEMLEVQLDGATRQYRAPLQLKATNGMLIIDDMGRQRAPPQVVLNRWIVPMEEGCDYLTLPTGHHFRVLFDVVLVFATNLRPADLADEAFLRRIGYKIHFESLTPKRYHEIWRQVCGQHGIDYDPAVCQGVIENLHRPSNVPLLPCQPRDLIGMALDYAAYVGQEEQLRPDALEWAWSNYFASLGK